jgi:putative intracellular protease/amidase
MATQAQKTVAFVLYPGITLLDMVGPLQVFASLRQFNDQYRPVVVAERIEPMPTDRPLRVTADQTFHQVPGPTVVIVPGGGEPTIKAMGNQVVGDYLRHAADSAPVGSARPCAASAVVIRRPAGSNGFSASSRLTGLARGPAAAARRSAALALGAAGRGW